MVQRPPRVQRPLGRHTTRAPRAGIGALVAATAFFLAGCQYLFGMSGMGPPGSSFGPADPGQLFSFDPGEFASLEPEGPLAEPLAVFTHGSATLAIAGVTTHLEGLNGASFSTIGTSVVWTDGAGAYLGLYGSGDAGEAWLVTLDRIHDGNHWTTHDPARCKVAVDHADKTGVQGTASCKGLRWVDAMAAFGTGEEAYVAGEDPFDAEITFEATP